MKAIVKGVLPPAPKPTLPRNDPEWLIRKMRDLHDRKQGSAKKIEQSRVRGRAVQQRNRTDQNKIRQLLREGNSIRKTAELTGCKKSWVFEVKKKMESEDAADQGNSKGI